MKAKEIQRTKETTTLEVYVSPEEAMLVIQGLAAGANAVAIDGWDRYFCGSFYLDEFRKIEFIVGKE